MQRAKDGGSGRGHGRSRSPACASRGRTTAHPCRAWCPSAATARRGRTALAASDHWPRAVPGALARRAQDRSGGGLRVDEAGLHDHPIGRVLELAQEPLRPRERSPFARRLYTDACGNPPRAEIGLDRHIARRIGDPDRCFEHSALCERCGVGVETHRWGLLTRPDEAHPGVRGRAKSKSRGMIDGAAPPFPPPGRRRRSRAASRRRRRCGPPPSSRPCPGSRPRPSARRRDTRSALRVAIADLGLT